MDITAKLMKLKERVNIAKSNYDRAKGKLEAAEQQIRDLGYENFNALTNDVAEFEVKIHTMEKELAEGIAKFEEKYGDLLK